MPDCTLQIITVDSNGKILRVQEPIVEEGITWETTRKGEPGKLTFTVLKDNELSFPEGAHVRFMYGETNVFYGFVFTKQRDKEHHITVTAYDQLRYLKNKTSYIFTGIRADQVLTRIADDFRLKVGVVDNTEYVIPKFNKDNMTLFDIVLDAIDATVIATGNLYFIYDNFGKIMLKNIKDTKLNVLVDSTTAENFDYSSSIDNNTYNRIVLTDSEDKSERNVAKAQDIGNINLWGVLQYYEAMSNGANTQANAKLMLELYNKVHRSLTIQGQKGDIRCRAGFGIYLDLYLGDLPGKQHMLIEKAVHTFKHNEHTMDLTLIGAETFYE
jgi:hypothetical protein